jgi:hypothetical protein
LLCGPYDPKYYIGWRAKLRRIGSKIAKYLKV